MNEGRHFESTQTLKDEIDGRERLEASNFDLKLRVHHLEDALKRFTHTDSMGAEVEEVSAENTNLKLAVHQHKLELQERNLVLAKAKAAIEALKKETERLRVVEADALRDSSDVGRAVKEATAKKDAVISSLEADKHDLARDFQQRLSAKDFELSEARHSGDTKERAAEAMSKLLEDTQRAMDEATADLAKAHAQRDEAIRENRQLSHSEARAVEMEEEVTQLRAQVELYMMQLTEQAQAFNSTRSELEGSVLELRSTLTERTAAHTATVEGIRKTYYSELEETSRAGKHRVELLFKDDLVSLKKQLVGREDDLKQLRKASERDRERYDEMIRETTQLRTEAKESRGRLANASEEMARVGEEAKQLRQHRHEMQDQRQADQVSIASLEARLETASTQLRSTDADLRTLQMEQCLLTVQQGDLKTKADFVESSARENERFKTDIAAAQAALKEAEASRESLRRELTAAKELERIVSTTGTQLVDTEKALAASRREQEATTQAVLAERLRADAAEANFAAARTRANAQLEDFKAERDLRGASDTSLIQQHSTMAEVTRVYEKVNERLTRWSRDLDVLLDGALSLPSSSSSSSSSSSPSFSSSSGKPDSIQDLLEHIVVGVERVGAKMGRVTRLRGLLMEQVNALAAEASKKNAEAQRAVELVSLRVGAQTQKLDMTAAVVNRDHSTRMKELQENKGFKESVLVEHTARLSANSDRIVELSKALEHEGRSKDALNNMLRDTQVRYHIAPRDSLCHPLHSNLF